MCLETLSALKGTGAMGELTAVYIGLSVGAVVARQYCAARATGPDRPHATVGRQVVDGLVLDEDVGVAVLRWPAEHHLARAGRLADGVHVGGTTRRPAEP